MRTTANITHALVLANASDAYRNGRGVDLVEDMGNGRFITHTRLHYAGTAAQWDADTDAVSDLLWEAGYAEEDGWEATGHGAMIAPIVID